MPACDIASETLSKLRARLRSQYRPLPSPYPAYVLLLSVSDGDRRAEVRSVTGSSFESVWQKALSALRAMNGEREGLPRWLRIDWPLVVTQSNWASLKRLLGRTKRNYFRLGLSLDEGFGQAFLEQELNANAVFYGGNKIDTAVLNEKNFGVCFAARFRGQEPPRFDDAQSLFLFSSTGLFVEDNEIHDLNPTGLDAGRRAVTELDEEVLRGLIESSSNYLSQQVKPDGTFVYGHHPCFDRRIDAYNTLRHASTTYAMIEAYEVTGDPALRGAIERSLKRLTGHLIQKTNLPDGTPAAFLTEANQEIKLGGNAVALLALAKHATVFDDRSNTELMTALAEGILFLQDRQTGAFRHVIGFPDLATREAYRTIYYEGEATFALMRFYELTGDPKWLDAVELSVRRFIAEDYTRHHDHWLAYCINELTRHRPEEDYFRFAIGNVSGYLDFVADRITTFPTLLELMMATDQTLRRLSAIPEQHHVLEALDLDHFEEALEKRARYLLNGHFWPEYAMFMRNPQRILGSFFIRHHAFRVRIDDVEHYLSGLIAYRRHAAERRAKPLSELFGQRVPAVAH